MGRNQELFATQIKDSADFNFDNFNPTEDKDKDFMDKQRPFEVNKRKSSLVDYQRQSILDE